MNKMDKETKRLLREKENLIDKVCMELMKIEKRRRLK